ncbi:MAG: tRNA (N(6)-L-threonylcarbamoyladenosine(37)-C(2))-methylthiotransferase MtaB [Patescibacteria group bacterium]|nr:tRNA (N(6)-L-threonylcarbamoyladenosine(37)-C(2))-methylthiotransferase MtaB [Patescibacteria group bacterium]MDD4611323.1 tRNA (N(6)-L-threonylcarbamoyladenosine(37)-C(2))-methylthiotransferase MtaB [Patescibacteria group bacterium]
MSVSFKIYTLGCKVNQYDSNDLARKLTSSGFELVKNYADLVIVNSCAVTQNAIRKGRQMINKARRENPGAKIVLMGCWPRVCKDKFQELSIDLVIKDRNISKIADKILNFKFLTLPTGRQVLNKIQNKKSKIQKNYKTRYFLKVQDGCEQFCSYCIIPYARGPLASRPAEEVIAEAEKLVESGMREIVLCGIHLGLYGKDTNFKKQEINLTVLLKNLLKIKNIGRIRLSSIEVTEVGDDLINLMAKSNELCKHLHIPLQSGSDKILKLMNRPYDNKYFIDKIRKLRKKMPNIAITTDVIVGFPVETEAEFQETYNFIKKIKFSKLHVFPFSAHEKTPAAKMSGRVNVKIIKERTEKLRKLGEKLEKEYRRKFIGKRLEVIVDGKNRGMSEYYFDIKLKNKNHKIGGLEKIKIK